MTDITSTSFGYMIAFLLPGLALLYALSLWSVSVTRLLNAFITPQSNIALFLLVIATAIGLGLLVGIPRELLFERWLCRKQRLHRSEYDQLSVEAKLIAYRVVIDESYRYHQFYGSLTVVLPVVYLGWLFRYWNVMNSSLKLLSAVGFLVIGAIMLYGAKRAYSIYADRAREILRKGGLLMPNGFPGYLDPKGGRGKGKGRTDHDFREVSSSYLQPMLMRGIQNTLSERSNELLRKLWPSADSQLPMKFYVAMTINHATVIVSSTGDFANNDGSTWVYESPIFNISDDVRLEDEIIGVLRVEGKDERSSAVFTNNVFQEGVAEMSCAIGPYLSVWGKLKQIDSGSRSA